MRAVVFHGPEDLRYEEVEVSPPGAGELLLRIDAALTCGTDVKTLHRGHPVMIPRVPTVFGHEFAGTVVGVGRGVSAFREGDRVVAANSAPCGECRLCAAGRPNLCEDLLFVNGAYGEFIVLPERLVAENVVRLADSLPAARAAFAEPLACALLAIDHGEVEAGKTVAVFGHGPLGCLLAMLAAARKARVLLIGKAGWRMERVRTLGLGECLDATASADIVADLRALTGGRGAEVTIDATGRPEVWEQAMGAVGRGGSVVFFGGCAPGTTVRLDSRRVHYEGLTLSGAFHHTPETIRRAVDLLETEAVVPDSLLTHRLGLEGVEEALKLMARGDALKVLIEP
ncbi:MAG: alcohol dehydrogenase catalytic domain-containing protein [Candidatus Rokubacteria bacterium]|nr:alcohol dehydrogenase catalytic domain-containing protein [Candidatus Rokubacteria bacterium]